MDSALIERIASRLRDTRADMIALYGPRGIQHRAVSAISDIAELWRDPLYSQRIAAQRNPGPFPFEMVQISLDALLDSLNPVTLNNLIEREQPNLANAAPLIGHVIAGNTPLLAWTSVIRALLVGSSSFVKLPSGPSSVWFEYFRCSLSDVSPELASLVDCASWKGGDQAVDEAFYHSVDKIVAYGSDDTMKTIRRLASATPVLEYGHRVSIAIVAENADWEAAAEGLATDILVYDQGGCLSPQTVFVEDDYGDTIRFGRMLASALAQSRFLNHLPTSPKRTALVIEARQMARFAEHSEVWEDPRHRWTVIARSESRFFSSPTHGVINVVPVALTNLTSALEDIARNLQGCALTMYSDGGFEELCVQLHQIGVCYICGPGDLQRPTIEWRENGLDALNSMLF